MWLLLVLLITIVGPSSAARPVFTLPREKERVVRFNTSRGIVKGALNVHIQPHSHQDPGWLKSFDERVPLFPPFYAYVRLAPKVISLTTFTASLSSYKVPHGHE